MWDFNYSDICLVKCILNSDQIQIKLCGEESGDDIHDSERRAISQEKNQLWLYISPTEKQLF